MPKTLMLFIMASLQMTT